MQSICTTSISIRDALLFGILSRRYGTLLGPFATRRSWRKVQASSGTNRAAAKVEDKRENTYHIKCDKIIIK